jgi:L-ascorbate metabolism protein UlaG (beta-lactamase superfamily)
VFEGGKDMKIKWLGHSSFVLISESGFKVLADPYKSGSYDGAVGYRPITEKVQVVMASHEHDDHFCLDGLPEGYETVTTPGRHEVGEVVIKGVKTYHDTSGGKERGRNIVFVAEMDGISICHLGDLGHTLSDEDLEAIGRVDVLLIPVGGFYTIGPREAIEVMKSISPVITIPMHYKTDVLGFPIKPVEDFLSLAGEYRRPNTSEIEIRKEDLGLKRIVVLEHAL